MDQLSMKQGEGKEAPSLQFLSRPYLLISAMIMTIPLWVNSATAQKTDEQGYSNPFVFDGLYLEGTLGDDTLTGSERSDHINAAAQDKDGGADIIYSLGSGNLVETNRFGSSAVYLSGGETILSARGSELYIQSESSSAVVIVEDIAAQATADSIDVHLSAGTNVLTSAVGFGRFQGGSEDDLFYFLPRDVRTEILHLTLSRGRDLIHISPNVRDVRVAVDLQQPLRVGVDETHIFYCAETTTIERLIGTDTDALVLFDLCSGGIIQFLDDDGRIQMTPVVPRQTPQQVSALMNYVDGFRDGLAQVARATFNPFDMTLVDYAAVVIDNGIKSKIFPGHYSEVVKILENGETTALGSLVSAVGTFIDLPGNLFNSVANGSEWKQQHIDKVAAVARLNKRLKEDLFPPNGVPTNAEMEDLIRRIFEGEDSLTQIERDFLHDLQNLFSDLDLSSVFNEEQALYLGLARYLAEVAGLACSLEAANPDDPGSAGLCDVALIAFETAVDMAILNNNIDCLGDGGLDPDCEREKEMRNRVYAAIKRLIKALRDSKIQISIYADVQNGAVAFNGSGFSFGQ